MLAITLTNLLKQDLTFSWNLLRAFNADFAAAKASLDVIISSSSSSSSSSRSSSSSSSSGGGGGGGGGGDGSGIDSTSICGSSSTKIVTWTGK